MKVEVAYALPEKQKIIEVDVAEGATVDDALLSSGIDRFFPNLDIAAAKVGVFGKAVKRTDKLRDGDRVEIYRPLIADPKAARKARAEKAKAKR